MRKADKILIGIWVFMAIAMLVYLLGNILERRRVDQEGTVYRAEIARLETELRECQAEPRTYIFTDERVEVLEKEYSYAKRVIVLLLDEYEVTNEQFENILKRYPDLYKWAQEVEE